MCRCYWPATIIFQEQVSALLQYEIAQGRIFQEGLQKEFFLFKKSTEIVSLKVGSFSAEMEWSFTEILSAEKTNKLWVLVWKQNVRRLFYQEALERQREHRKLRIWLSEDNTRAAGATCIQESILRRPSQINNVKLPHLRFSWEFEHTTVNLT